MNKLYDAIDPVVIDDELLRKAIDHQDDGKDNNNKKGSSAIEFLEVPVLTLSLQSCDLVFLF